MTPNDKAVADAPTAAPQTVWAGLSDTTEAKLLETLPASGQAPANDRTFPGPAVFVWGVWAVLLYWVASLAYQFNTCVPYNEDWNEFLPVVIGEQPITLHWLWEQEWEHRLFLLRLIGGGLLKLARGEYWGVTTFFITSLGAVAAALIVAAGRRRGQLNYTDAIIPLALLHWPMGEHLFWATNLNYLLPTFAGGAMLASIVCWGVRLTPWTGALTGACLAMLPLCGAGGLVYLPAFGLWVAVCAVYAWRSADPGGRRTALVLGISLLTAVNLTGFYFIGYTKSQFAPPPATVWATLEASLAFLTESFGRTAEWMWPYSWALLLAVVMGATALVIAAVCLRRGQQQAQAVGLLLFLGSVLMMALALGWGRGGHGVSYMWTYWILPVLILPCLYFIFDLYAPPNVAQFVQACLIAVLAVTATLNARTGVAILTDRSYKLDAFEQDVRAGMPPYMLLATHGGAVGMTNDGCYLAPLEKLRAAEVGFFRYIQPDPPMQEVPLDLTPVEVHEVQWNVETKQCTGGAGGYLTFALPEPMNVASVRVRFAAHSSNYTGMFQMSWRKSGAADFPPDNGIPYVRGNFHIKEPAVAMVGDTIDRIRVYPDALPFDCQFAGIELLIAAPPE